MEGCIFFLVWHCDGKVYQPHALRLFLSISYFFTPEGHGNAYIVSSVHCLSSPWCCNTSESHRPLVSCWKHQFLFHLVLCWLIIAACYFELLFYYGFLVFCSWPFCLRIMALSYLPSILRMVMVWPHVSLLSYGPCCLLSPIPLRAFFLFVFLLYFMDSLIPSSLSAFLYFVISLLFISFFGTFGTPSCLLLTTRWFHA